MYYGMLYHVFLTPLRLLFCGGQGLLAHIEVLMITGRAIPVMVFKYRGRTMHGAETGLTVVRHVGQFGFGPGPGAGGAPDCAARPLSAATDAGPGLDALPVAATVISACDDRVGSPAPLAAYSRRRFSPSAEAGVCVALACGRALRDRGRSRRQPREVSKHGRKSTGAGEVRRAANAFL